MVQIVTLAGTSEQKDVGYCVSTVGLDGVAEIDSIFVLEGFRGKGLGASSSRAPWIGSTSTMSRKCAPRSFGGMRGYFRSTSTMECTQGASSC